MVRVGIFDILIFQTIDKILVHILHQHIVQIYQIKIIPPLFVRFPP